MSIPDQIVAAYPKCGQDLAHAIVCVATWVGAHPFDLANLINFESAGTFSPSVRNPKSNATGLIQFMPFTAERLGTTVDDLAKLTPVEQMGWVLEYFRPYRGKLKEAADLYMTVFYPAAVGKPDYKFSARVVEMNPGILTPRHYAAWVNKKAKLPRGA